MIARQCSSFLCGPSLDVVAASRPEAYTVASADDPAYREKHIPKSIGRKSKGTDFAWFADKWENGRAVNLLK